MGVITGTAGHIDHGKSRLVQYLTGEDPDRLKEEKERGITIELGYAFMPLSDGGRMAFIDVPGHEGFIRQMVAGTATVDFFMLVVSADEGVMPQTREHLDILKLLDVKKGVAAITKCDLVDSEMQELVEVEVTEFLEEKGFTDVPVFRVSPVDGFGMEELRDALDHLASSMESRSAQGPFRLDIDRVFVLKGFGTIIAGTVVSGSVSTGDDVQIMPGGKKYKVREMRVNSVESDSGSVGDRIALNLSGLNKEEVYRGCCAAEPGYLEVRNSLDTSLTLLQSAQGLKRHQRVRFHTGTAEVMARAVPVEENFVLPGTDSFAHFQLESPVVAMPGDRFVLRSYSPVITIGGGVILETGTRKVRKKYSRQRLSHLKALDRGDLETVVREMLQDAGLKGVTVDDICSGTPVSGDEAAESMRRMQEAGAVHLIKEGRKLRAVGMDLFAEAKKKLEDELSAHHSRRPASPGIPLAMVSRMLADSPQWFVKNVIEHMIEKGELQRRGDFLALPTHPREIPPELQSKVQALVSEVESHGNRGMKLEDIGEKGLAESLRNRGMLMELAPGVLTTMTRTKDLCGKVSEQFEEEGFRLGELRDYLGVSRKDALRWAELFDSLGWTRRSGDRRLFTGE
ncbi:MAG: selenocysteine-specific translation elongation factor [Candidatus Aegiribacteria sp.]|nr:selenocysteine-specific translation elongation factor [Candidatus Aegiribacteria sp.]MBD3295039.1 selenocysteine-specific translation elongation factor [Candidatus Fermentibacteria bacterium]